MAKAGPGEVPSLGLDGHGLREQRDVLQCGFFLVCARYFLVVSLFYLIKRKGWRLTFCESQRSLFKPVSCSSCFLFLSNREVGLHLFFFIYYISVPHYEVDLME